MLANIVNNCADGSMYCIGASLETAGHGALLTDTDNDPAGACAGVKGADGTGCNNESIDTATT